MRENADPTQPIWLPRACRERPRGGRAAEQRDELAASHSITSSARASTAEGTSRPSAFATVKFTTRSNLVGCSTGMSPGFTPRRKRLRAAFERLEGRHDILRSPDFESGEFEAKRSGCRFHLAQLQYDKFIADI